MTSNNFPRVISEGDGMIVDNNTLSDFQQKVNSEDIVRSEDWHPPRFANERSPNGSSDFASSPGNDPMDTQEAPISLIESAIEDDQYQDNSSLSCDDSEESDSNMLLLQDRHTGPNLNPAPRPAMLLNRIEAFVEQNDSTSSCQSSQRAISSQNSDWGFFEDVHQSSDGKKNSSPRGRKNSRQVVGHNVNKDRGKTVVFQKNIFNFQNLVT